MSRTDDLLEKILAENRAMREQLSDIREDLALTLGLKRKSFANKKYQIFEKWARSLKTQNYFLTPKVMGEFRVSKPTAIGWMRFICAEFKNEFKFRENSGPTPSAVLIIKKAREDSLRKSSA